MTHVDQDSLESLSHHLFYTNNLGLIDFVDESLIPGIRETVEVPRLNITCKGELRLMAGTFVKNPFVFIDDDERRYRPIYFSDLVGALNARKFSIVGKAMAPYARGGEPICRHEEAALTNFGLRNEVRMLVGISTASDGKTTPVYVYLCQTDSTPPKTPQYLFEYRVENARYQFRASVQEGMWHNNFQTRTDMVPESLFNFLMLVTSPLSAICFNKTCDEICSIETWNAMIVSTREVLKNEELLDRLRQDKPFKLKEVRDMFVLVPGQEDHVKAFDPYEHLQESAKRYMRFLEDNDAFEAMSAKIAAAKREAEQRCDEADGKERGTSAPLPQDKKNKRPRENYEEDDKGSQGRWRGDKLSAAEGDVSSERSTAPSSRVIKSLIVCIPLNRTSVDAPRNAEPAVEPAVEETADAPPRDAQAPDAKPAVEETADAPPRDAPPRGAEPAVEGVCRKGAEQQGAGASLLDMLFGDDESLNPNDFLPHAR